MTEARAPRLLDVTAYTTLDFVEARVEGRGWTDRAVGVANVDVRGEEPSGEPTAVTLSLELDDADVEAIPQHATRLDLSAADARALAEALLDCAVTVDGEP